MEVQPVKPKNRNAIHFARAGKKPSKIKTNPTGIFHLASDWVLVSDLSQKYIFPTNNSLAELRPDVVIFSNCLRWVVLLELTCPSKENMPSCHATKVSKYSSLLELIRNNKWYVDLFAIEFGACGFPSNSLKSCLQKLGLPNKLMQQTIIRLGRVSMESSFCIWMHRNSKEWTGDTLPNTTTNN